MDNTRTCVGAEELIDLLRASRNAAVIVGNKMMSYNGSEWQIQYVDMGETWGGVLYASPDLAQAVRKLGGVR